MHYPIYTCIYLTNKHNTSNSNFVERNFVVDITYVSFHKPAFSCRLILPLQILSL